MTKIKLPITADQREINRLWQSLMKIAKEAHCWTPNSDHQEQVRNRIIQETERALTRLANARLIAAAPGMYQLIEKCYKVLHMGVWEVDETDEDVCSQINDIMCNYFSDDWRPRREPCD